MAVTNEKVDSVRLSRFEIKRLSIALALSLAVHFLAWGGYELGKITGLWQRIYHLAHALPAAKIKSPATVQNQDPTIFLDVDQAAPEPPKNTKYYSSKNSQAAQTEASSRNSSQPKLNGKQSDVPNPRDVPRTANSKPQPVQPQSPSQIKLAAPPPNMLQAGDLKLAKLETSPQKNDSTPERPRTLNEARAQQQNPRPKIQSQQDGGVPKRLKISAMDAKAMPFGAYDEAILDAIWQHWVDGLDKIGYTYDRQGKVIFSYRLYSDGRVTDITMLGDTADDNPGGIWAIMCRAAIETSAPFAPWPSDLLHEQGANYQDRRIQFNYIVP